MWYLYVLAVVAGIAVGVGIMLALQKARAKRDAQTIVDAEEQAKQIINEGIKTAENKKREALLEAKEEIHRDRTEYEREEGAAK